MNQSIIQLISQGESETVEIKSTFGKEVIESLCAFANNIGGAVLVGIENSGKITGVNYLEILTKEQSLGINLAAILGYEQFKDYNLFGVISGNVTYKSPIISAVISADAYTTQDRIGSLTQDIKFERFIKKDGQKPIEGALDFRFNLPEDYLQSQIKFLTISSGKMKLRWGPNDKSTIGLSETALNMSGRTANMGF